MDSFCQNIKKNKGKKYLDVTLVVFMTSTCSLALHGRKSKRKKGKKINKNKITET